MDFYSTNSWKLEEKNEIKSCEDCIWWEPYSEALERCTLDDTLNLYCYATDCEKYEEDEEDDQEQDS